MCSVSPVLSAIASLWSIIPIRGMALQNERRSCAPSQTKALVRSFLVEIAQQQPLFFEPTDHLQTASSVGLAPGSWRVVTVRDFEDVGLWSYTGASLP